MPGVRPPAKFLRNPWQAPRKRPGQDRLPTCARIKQILLRRTGSGGGSGQEGAARHCKAADGGFTGRRRDVLRGDPTQIGALVWFCVVTRRGRAVRAATRGTAETAAPHWRRQGRASHLAPRTLHLCVHPLGMPPAPPAPCVVRAGCCVMLCYACTSAQHSTSVQELSLA